MEILHYLRTARLGRDLAGSRRATSVALALSFILAGCATTGLSPSATPVGSGAPASASTASWQTITHEHVDLWLHGYALLSRDTASVPLFAPGYRERVSALKARRNVVTNLDANRDRLAQRLAANPALVNGQFVPFYFSTFEEIQQVVNQFLRVGGDPRSTSDPNLQMLFGILASSYPTAADRDWLRLFVQSLADERTRFYHDYWMSEQTSHAAARRAVDSLWVGRYRARLERFLTNTRLNGGEFILSLPLDGEGRTVTATSRQNAIAVAFPATPDSAVDAIYVFAHEAVSSIIGPVIADNTTPAEQRSGVVATYTANAAVRTGAMLLQRAAPELASDYMRYYLREARTTTPAANLPAAFSARFSLPDAIRDALTRQLDLVLGGI